MLIMIVVCYKRGSYLARLLVGVGHETADEVRLAVVQSLHQGNQGDEVDGGDSLPS